MSHVLRDLIFHPSLNMFNAKQKSNKSNSEYLDKRYS